MSSSSSSPSPTLPTPPISRWKGVYIDMGYNADIVHSFYNTHYEILNGTGVQYFNILTTYERGIDFHNPHTLYGMKIFFTFEQSIAETEDFLHLSEHGFTPLWWFDDISTYDSLPSLKTHKVLYSYEGLKSYTKSAAKIAKIAKTSETSETKEVKETKDVKNEI